MDLDPDSAHPVPRPDVDLDPAVVPAVRVPSIPLLLLPCTHTRAGEWIAMMDGDKYCSPAAAAVHT